MTFKEYIAFYRIHGDVIEVAGVLRDMDAEIYFIGKTDEESRGRFF